jgi:hypothetical protein
VTLDELCDLLRSKITRADDDGLDAIELMLSELPVADTVADLVLVLGPEIERRRKQLAQQAQVSSVGATRSTGSSAPDMGRPAGRGVRRRQRRRAEDEP